ncbi:DUF7535 family protein [Halocatena halophila]|uniref:DUF7535 family protein n=1 Tax=Halocatena halophila TaxID=2814576 RepID=UPI002ED0B1C6
MAVTTDDAGEEPTESVTELHLGRPDLEMDAIGWLLFIVLGVLLIPLLPFMIILWLIDRIGPSSD